jgi:hypothetical protein
MADNKPGLGSENMSDADKKRIHEAGGKASHSSGSTASTSSKASGAAGKTEAAKRGGEHSRRS